MKHERFMQEALKEARHAQTLGEVPIGAVIVYQDTIVARGHNLRQTAQKATMHAEIMAIEKACEHFNSWRLEDCDLYVTVEPCPMCAGAIIMSRMRSVYYGVKEYKSGAHDSIINLFDQPFNHHVGVQSGILEEECKTLLQSFFKQLRERT